MGGYWKQLLFGSWIGGKEEEKPAVEKARPGDDRVIRDAAIRYEITKDGAVAVGMDGEAAGILEIPVEAEGKRVVGVGEGAFYGHGEITGVILPEGVKWIDRWAFRECGRIRRIQWPRGEVSLGEGAFMGCRSLVEVELPARIAGMETGAFAGCVNLESVMCPDSEKCPAGKDLRPGWEMEFEGESEGLYPDWKAAFEGCERVTVYGPEGSFAKRYAEGNGYRFLAMNGVKAREPGRWVRVICRGEGGGKRLRCEEGRYVLEWWRLGNGKRMETGERQVAGKEEKSEK